MQLWFTHVLLQLFSSHKLVANTEWQMWDLGIMETSKYVRSYQLLENLKTTALTLLSIVLGYMVGNESTKKNSCRSWTASQT